MNSEKPVMLARFVPHRGKLVVMFLGLVLFTAAAAYMLLAVEPADLSGYSRLALWLALVLCPVFGTDMLARVVRRTPTLVAVEEGLVLRSVLGFTAPIPWREIGGVRSVIMGKKPYLAIYLDDPNGTFARMGTASRLIYTRSHAAGVPNITFREIHLGASPAQAAAVLEGIRQGREADG